MQPEEPLRDHPLPLHLAHAWRYRGRRKYYLARAYRRRRFHLTAVADRTGAIRPGDILGFATLRNEAQRLPYWLAHHRQLGVAHFLIVDNGSNDDSAALLADQPDVSLWQTGRSYKRSRFGMDWITGLLARHGVGHWCLTLDADELFIPPRHGARSLAELTHWCDTQGLGTVRALMLDLYPEGPLGSQSYVPGQDPTEVLPFFDGDGYRTVWQPRLQTLLVRGGIRDRTFFGDAPAKAPTMNKTPLVKWARGYVYNDSTHSLLPRWLNRNFPEPGRPRPIGALLHTKFLPEIRAKSAEEKARREHFSNSALYEDYYDALIQGPVLWHENAVRYHGWDQLEALGLVSRGAWTG